MRNDFEIKKMFLKLLNTRHIESINVSLICDELGIKRQTFYYYYRDIYELVESIFDEYTTELFSEKMDAYYLNKIIDFTYDNLNFITPCINSGLKEAVNKFFYNLLLPFVDARLDTLEAIKSLNNSDVNEIRNYHVNAISLYLIDKFKSDENLNLDHIVNKIYIFLDKEVLSRTAELYYIKRKEI